MFESINKSIERAKRRRLDALARFHIGDVCYPLYQTWMPVIWGIIVDINVTTHKISVNLNGVIRQYDPEELVLTSPEDKEPNTTNEDRQRVLDEIERTDSCTFIEASWVEQPAFEGAVTNFLIETPEIKMARQEKQNLENVFSESLLGSLRVADKSSQIALRLTGKVLKENKLENIARRICKAKKSTS